MERKTGRGGSDDVAPKLALGSVLISGALLVVLVAAYLSSESRLAFAQAADSLSDVFTALALMVSMRLASVPPDANHPMGHQGAEPVAALVAAVMAGVLAFEVIRGAVMALLFGAEPVMGDLVLGAFAAKVFAKLVLLFLTRRALVGRSSPALRALYVDARNDVAVGLLAVFGFFAAKLGADAWDAWLALPVGLYVGVSGFDLARENIRFLMGEAPPPERRKELLALATDVEGVRSAHELLARYHGGEIDVLVHVVVDDDLTVRAAHDIGHCVEARLTREADVCHAIAHVDVDPSDRDPGEHLA